MSFHSGPCRVRIQEQLPNLRLALQSSVTWVLVSVGLVSFAFPDKHFPQGIVGTAGGIEARTAVELFLDTEGDLEPASGLLRFFAQNGNPFRLEVTGEGLSRAQLTEVSFQLEPSSGKVKVRFDLASIDGTQAVFWAQVAEQSGQVGGKMQFDFFESGLLSTSIPVPAVDARPVRTFTARRFGTLKTGLAISNPGSTPAEYWLVALDDAGDVTSVLKSSLPAKGQTAQFVDQLFSELGPDFDGFVAVVSDRNLAALALEQNELELSTASDVGSLRLPFLVGHLEDYLAREVDRSSEPVITEGTLTLTKGSTLQTGRVSQDGSYLVGPLTAGEWAVRVDAEGFLPFEQVLSFPRVPKNLELTGLHYINPEWLSSTLAVNTSFQGTLVKPDLVLNFFFDTSAGNGELNEALRQGFKQWVTTELPQRRILVRDELGEEVVLGGHERYLESNTPPAGGSESTVVLKKNTALTRPSKATVFVQTVGTTSQDGVLAAVGPEDATEPQAGEVRVIRAALVEYNPALLADLNSLGEQVAEVARAFWAAVFLRTEAVSSVGSFALSGDPGETEKLSTVYTILARLPKTFVSTPHDAYYWEVLRNRPAGTRISSSVEVLPRR